MIRPILPGLFAEGSTDYRFLGVLIRRTFEEIALEFNDPLEISEVIPLYSTSSGFVAQVVDVANQSLKNGISVLCACRCRS